MNIVKVFIICLLGIGFVSCSHEKETIQTKAGQIIAIDSLIQQEIAAKHIPGAVVQVKKGDSILHQAAYGYAKKYDFNLEPLENPQEMIVEHLFDLASLTKVCATTFGIMKLVDEGKVSLDDPIQRYLPEFDSGDKADITVRHLLTHTSGLAQWKPTYYHASNKRERCHHISELPLKWKVGKERHYSDLGFMLLGDLIEKVSGHPMDQYLQQKLYEPLGLEHIAFNPLQKDLAPIAATSHGNPFEKQMVYDDDFGYRVEVEPGKWDGWRQYTLQGEVNDGNAWYANGGVAGHAGLFSTVNDLQVLVDLLLQDGRYNGSQFISPAVVDTFLTEDEFGNGLGWAMDKNFIDAEGSPVGTFGHIGFTGTHIVVAPSDSLSIILLTNRQHVGRQENGYYFNLGPLRQAIFDTVKAAL
ncbi:serine hydrolase domain-containing protein [Fodinibius halophilus]|uniref:Serine hydrolase n=1 Tax=Fodinibius halophilus TaxID=1736908 RepID=A0A6M1T7W9_9BACT|nr:serine hydrolase [Fodinibius halophilus]NGP89515.1 serine hydrolase [Fodinibius halophilus]